MFHLARKKIQCINENGEQVTPTEPNGIKLESFIFDVFPLSARMSILECKREEEFSPVKNMTGSDSPETARTMLSAMHGSWVKAAGGTVEDGATIEVAPSTSYGGEGLEAVVGGKTFSAVAMI
mmetsp:Transcript_13374/g.33478  ORF Transcript_13374/g.33478 Transcript_13374/m.33478 type:complete len:123 (+) Transcript_13374:1029-1397(+)